MNNVKSAAIRSDHNGALYTLPAPARHHHIIALMVAAGLPTPIQGKQGFLLADGRFCGRKFAKIVAIKAGQQLPRASGSQELFSEDVW